MYAIIATGGKQYKVSKGDKVRVEKLDAEVGSKVVLDQVLLVSADKVTVGNPTVAGASVEAEVTAQGKDRKVIVYKYKPKTGYHKKNGHRQLFTELEIKSLLLDGAELADAEEKKPAKKAAKKAAPKKEEVAEEKAEEAVEEKIEETVEAAAEAAEK